MEADLNYYRRRSAQEAAAAQAAQIPRVRDVHLELARGYDARVAQLDTEQRRGQIRLVDAA
jgi:ABC-type protease/lipase transport system fused ATPase/permease subunit